jgi:hypothetical protein
MMISSSNPVFDSSTTRALVISEFADVVVVVLVVFGAAGFCANENESGKTHNSERQSKREVFMVIPAGWNAN